MLNSKKRKAFRAVIIVSLVLLWPVGSFFYYFYQKTTAQKFPEYPWDRSAPSDFLWQDHQGEYLSQAWLQNKITFVFFNLNETLSLHDKEFASKLEDWVKTHLSLKDQTKIHLVSVSSARLINDPWHFIQISKTDIRDEIKSFLKQENTPSSFWIMLNNQGIIEKTWATQDLNFEELRPSLSQFNFELYLQDYLSRRTFFGPKRL